MAKGSDFAVFDDEDRLVEDIPELEDYAALNPEYALPRSRRAGEQISRLYFEHGRDLKPPETDRRRQLFRLRIIAIIDQLKDNNRWRSATEARNLKPTGLSVDDIRKFSKDKIEQLMGVTVAATDSEFGASPRTFYKTIQEVLSPPTERFTYDRDATEYVSSDLSDLVIDPTLVNDTLLENLGLAELIPPKGTSKAEKTEIYAQSIPAIKQMLAKLEPFKLTHGGNRSRLHYFRLMRIGKGVHEGELLGTQNIDGKKVLFRTDLHGAYRRIDHIDEQYSEEIGRLQSIVDRISVIDRNVATRWSDLKNSDELKGIQQELFVMVDELRFVKNDHKRKMKSLIEKCTGLSVKRKVREKHGEKSDGTRGVIAPAKVVDVLNPGAARAQWNTVKSSVSQRIAEIARIRKYLAQDRTHIESYMKSQSLPFDRFYATVEDLHGKFKILDEKHVLTHEDAAQIRINLLRVSQELKTHTLEGFSFGKGVQFEPHLTFARRMIGHIEKVCGALRAEDLTSVDRSAVASEFLKIYVVAKIQRVYQEIQRFFDEDLKDDRLTSFRLMLNTIEKFYVMVSNKRVDESFEGKSIETAEYNPLFGEIYHLCLSLRKRAKAGMELDSNDPDFNVKRKALFDEMRQRIRDFKFDELLEKYFGDINHE